MAVFSAAAGTHPRLARLRSASAGPFPVITLILLIVIGLGSFAGATYLEVFDDGSGEPMTTDANSFSRSAIGHRAFVAALRKLGVPVEISRFRTLDKVGQGNLLLVLEPDLGEAGKAVLSGMVDAPHALLVLPKWLGHRDPDKPIWVDRMKLRDNDAPQEVLDQIISGAAVVRRSDALVQNSDRFGGSLRIVDPQYIDKGDLGALILTKDGTLLGKIDTGPNQVWVLSDPDLINNFGLDESENGVVALNIVRALLPPGGTVIVDETAHGFEVRPNLLRTLLRPPFLPVGIAFIAALLVLGWAGASRFGAPQREGEALAAGKLTLVNSTAQLLRIGAGRMVLLQSYRRLVLADAIAELHGPTLNDEMQQAAWLDRAAAHRGLTARVEPVLKDIQAQELAGRLDPGRALRLALDLYRWKQEILHGNVARAERN
jgi:hypothetical protein